jgi:hypothetical protein
MIMTLIVLMTIVGSLVVTTALVASMIVALYSTMLPVAQVTDAHDRKMSHLLLSWLLLLIGNLLKNASHFVGRLTLLEKGNAQKRVRGHCLVYLHELKLMHLGLCKEDLFALLLRCRHLYCLTDVAAIKVAGQLYSTPHELMGWHEGELLGGANPADQLVTNIGEPGDCLKVIPDALVEVGLCMICFSGALHGEDACPFSETYVLKTQTHQVEQCWTIVCLCI